MPQIYTIGATLLLASMLASCGGGGSDGATAPAPPQTAQSLTLGGGATQVLAGDAPVALSATPATPATVTWTLSKGVGSLSATTGNSITYVPPACCLDQSNNSLVVITAKAGDAEKSFTFRVYPATGEPGLSLIAGTVGSAGNLDGKGQAARFGNIIDMAPDNSGNLLLLDTDRTDDFNSTGHPRLRRVSAGGEVTTLAALPAAARRPLSVSVAPDNTALMLASTADGLAVYRLQADGGAALWLAPARTDQSATRIVAAAGGAAYLIGVRHVSAVAANGDSRVLAGTEGDADAACRDGMGGAARLRAIADAVLDNAGNLVVSDCFSVRKIAPTGAVTTLAGDLAGGTAVRDGTGPGAHFGDWHNALAVDRNGELRALDFEAPVNDAAGVASSAFRLRRITSAGTTSTLLSGQSRGDFGLPSNTAHVAGALTSYKLVRYLSSGVAVVATAGQLYTLDGATLAAFAGNEGDVAQDIAGPVAAARFVRPRSVTANPSGTLYVLEESGKVVAIDRAGNVGEVFRDAPPVSQILARDDSLYVAHVPRTYQFDRWKFSHAVIYVRSAADGYATPALLAGNTVGILESTPRIDGAGASATFYKADMLGFDADGNLYVEDTLNGAPLYRKVTPAGVVSTISAPPAGVGAAPDGYRYLFDTAAALVYRVGADGAKTVVAGAAGQDGIRLGALPGSLSSANDLPNTLQMPNTPQMAAITPTGPRSFALISGGAVLKLVLPK
jgi:hypothetical protein